MEIRDVANMVVVSDMEILSPANKSGDGRADYLRKRRTLLSSDVNLIEVDLLRGGARPSMRQPLPDYPYFVLVHRAAVRPLADVWPIGLRDPLPQIPIPLLPCDADACLDLQAAFTGAFDSVGYERALEYSSPVRPPVSEADAAWIGATIAGPA